MLNIHNFKGKESNNNASESGDPNSKLRRYRRFIFILPLIPLISIYLLPIAAIASPFLVLKATYMAIRMGLKNETFGEAFRENQVVN